MLVREDDPTRHELALKIARAEIEALERTIERDRGDYGGTPKDPIVKPASGTSREQAKPGETIMELFEQYAVENPNDVRLDTLNQARRDIGTYLQVVGVNYPPRMIDKATVREWKGLLMKLPVKATESTVFKGMTLPQIVEHNEKIQNQLLPRARLIATCPV